MGYKVAVVGATGNVGREMLNILAERNFPADEVVALGASIQGMALTQEASEMILLDVTPHTLGIMVVGGYFEDLIPLNTTVPTSRSKVFTTIRDNQTAVKILVMQGESTMARVNAMAADWYHTGRLRGLEEISRRIERTTVEEVLAYLREFPAENFTVLTLGPEPLRTE